MTTADLWSREKLNGLNILCRLFCPQLLSYFIMFSAFPVVLLLFPISYLLVEFKSQVSWPRWAKSDFFALNSYIRWDLQNEMPICFCLVLGCWHACHRDVSAMQMEVWSQGSVSQCVRRGCTIRGNSVCSSACYLARALSTCCSFSLLLCKTSLCLRH